MLQYEQKEKMGVKKISNETISLRFNALFPKLRSMPRPGGGGGVGQLEFIYIILFENFVGDYAVGGGASNYFRR